MKATEKQISYLLSLSKNQYNNQAFDLTELSKVAASKLIDAWKHLKYASRYTLQSGVDFLTPAQGNIDKAEKFTFGDTSDHIYDYCNNVVLKNAIYA